LFSDRVNTKGSCSVLGRTVKTPGKNIAGWLVAPGDDAQPAT
jgi:hypothetical protein